MSDDGKLAALDARLRGLIGRLDARPGFEERVMARVAALAAHAGADPADLRAQFERRRELARRRLARDAWTHGFTIAGIGIAAAALVWRFAPEIRRWALATDADAVIDPLRLGGYCAVVLLLVLWPILRRLPGLRNL